MVNSQTIWQTVSIDARFDDVRIDSAAASRRSLGLHVRARRVT